MGNLGDVLLKTNRKKEAEHTLRKAISICDKSFPVGSGVFRGSLARLLAENGSLSEALQLIEQGEQYITALPDVYGKFLCTKGHIQVQAGQITEAQSSLAQAKKLCKTVQFQQDNELSHLILELEQLLDAKP